MCTRVALQDIAPHIFKQMQHTRLYKEMTFLIVIVPYILTAIEKRMEMNHTEVMNQLSRCFAMMVKIHKQRPMATAREGQAGGDVGDDANTAVQIPLSSMKQLMEFNTEIESDKAKKDALVCLLLLPMHVY